MDEHTEECDCTIYGGGNRTWVQHTHWNDADVCTCPFKEVMARRAIYGDERLIAALPFEPVPPERGSD